jgi:hypothetical protein
MPLLFCPRRGGFSDIRSDAFAINGSVEHPGKPRRNLSLRLQPRQ